MWTKLMASPNTTDYPALERCLLLWITKWPCAADRISWLFYTCVFFSFSLQTVIKELNRLGMIIDLSHSSHKTALDAIQTSEAPVIFSHSSAYALCNSTRNVHDDVLKLLVSKIKWGRRPSEACEFEGVTFLPNQGIFCQNQVFYHNFWCLYTF